MRLISRNGGRNYRLVQYPNPAEAVMGRFEAMPRRSKIAMATSLARRGLSIKGGLKSGKSARAMVDVLDERAGTKDAYVMSRVGRNELGRENTPKSREMGRALRDWERSKGFTVTKAFDRRLLALAAVPAAAAAVPYWKQTPDDNGASARLARRRLPTAKTSDVRAVARGNGFRLGDDDHVRRISASMRERGFKADEPITLEQYRNGKMLVRGGHHRLAAAEQAGLRRVPVRVVESDKPAPRSLVTLATSRAVDRHIKNSRTPYKREKPGKVRPEGKVSGLFNRAVSRIDSQVRE